MSAKISRVSEAHTKRAATAASKVLGNSRSSKRAKASAGNAMATQQQVKKGGVAYVIRKFDVESTVVTSAMSVHAIKDGASKYGKALRRLAKK